MSTTYYNVQPTLYVYVYAVRRVTIDYSQDEPIDIVEWYCWANKEFTSTPDQMWTLNPCKVDAVIDKHERWHGELHKVTRQVAFVE